MTANAEQGSRLLAQAIKDFKELGPEMIRLKAPTAHISDKEAELGQ